MTREPIILFEGPCAYAVRREAAGAAPTYQIMIYSSNAVTHVDAGASPSADRAETTCRRLNAYPRQTRESFGLL